ncbi:MAG: rod shape-determining protein MreC [Planctomycetota bacterium]
MAHSLARLVRSERLMPLAVVALLGTSILPISASRIVTSPRVPLLIVLAPLSQSLGALGRWVRPPAPAASDERIAALETEVEAWRTRARALEAQNQALRGQLDEATRGGALAPGLAIRQQRAPVIAASGIRGGSVLTLRAGTRDGVDVGTVAAVRGVDLLGRVERVSDRTCAVVPITASGAGVLLGVVVLGDGIDAPELACELAPAGDGLLQGDLADPGALVTPGQTPPEVTPGMLVRLADNSWPASAQRLIIGEVEAVEPAENAPLRLTVTVRPRVALQRAGEAVLRIPAEPKNADGGDG